MRRRWITGKFVDSLFAVHSRKSLSASFESWVDVALVAKAGEASKKKEEEEELVRSKENDARRRRKKWFAG